MPSWFNSSTLYKGLLTLVLALIAIEYLFGSIIETKRWEIFTFNMTRLPSTDRTVQHIHSPLLNSLIHKLNDTKQSNKTASNSTKVNATTQVTIVVNVSSVPEISSYMNVNSSTEFEDNPDFSKINTTAAPYCPEIPPHSQGRVKIVKTPVPTVTELEKRFSWLKIGGHWEPEQCKAQKKVALIIPFRCRGEHLLLFLQHMHPFLKRQQLDYTIFIIEQDGESPFNRAMLMNVGFVEALKISDFDCFIFHDIDLLPEDDRNIYSCPDMPRHMSVAVDIFHYKLPYPSIFGGVSAISKEHFLQLNGFSNMFWGWGGEDDDMSNRIRYHNLHIARYPISIARYTMLTHKKDTPSPNRYDVLKTGAKRYNTDGLNSLKYTLKLKKQNVLYTWFLVEVDQPS